MFVRYLLMIVFLLIAGTNTSFGIKKIKLNKGVTLYGFVTGVDATHLNIKLEDSRNVTLAKGDIESMKDVDSEITLKNGIKQIAFISNITSDEVEMITNTGIRRLQVLDIDTIKHEVDQSSKTYYFLGLTALFPGLANLTFGYTSGSWGGRVSYGAIIRNSRIGLQGNLLLNLKKTRYFEHNLSLGGGFTAMNHHATFYAGPFYDINYHGFFAEIGVGYDLDGIRYDRTEFIPLLQVGYVYRFNKM